MTCPPFIAIKKGDQKYFNHSKVNNWKFLVIVGLATKIRFRLPCVWGAIRVFINFFYIHLDKHDEHVRTNTNVTPDAKWLRHINFDNPGLCDHKSKHFTNFLCHNLCSQAKNFVMQNKCLPWKTQINGILKLQCFFEKNFKGKFDLHKCL